MAKPIPAFTALGETPSPRPGQGVARIDTSGMDAPLGVDRASISAGGSLMAGAADLAVAQDHWDSLRAEDALNKLKNEAVNLSVGEDGFQTKRSADAVTQPLLKDYGERFAQAQTNISAGLQNDRQRTKFGQRAQVSEVQFKQDILKHTYAESIVYQKQVFDSGFKIEVRNAQVHWDDPYAIQGSKDRLYMQIDFLAKQSGWKENGPQVIALRQASNTEIATSVIGMALANGDFEYAENYYKLHKDELDLATIKALKKEIHVELKERLTAKVKDFQAMAVDGVQIPPDSIPNEQEMVRVYGPEEGGRRFRDAVVPLLQLNKDVQRVAGITREDQEALYAKRRPTAGEGYAQGKAIENSLGQAINLVRKRQDEDPGGFVVSTSAEVRNSWMRAQAISQTGDANAARRAFEDFSRSSLEEQRRLGMPKNAVLPNSIASAVVDSFYADKGQNAAQTIAQLSSQWGEAWPQVYSQIQKSIPGSAVVIGSGMDPTSAAAGLLVRASQMSDKDLKEGLAADQITDVHKIIPEKLIDYRLALSQTVGGNELFNTFSDQTEKLALMYVRQGKKPKDAAELAYQDVIGSRYEFVSSRGAIYMVPKAYEVNQVVRGADRAIVEIGSLDLEIPKSRAGLNEEQRKSAYISILKSQAYWLTAPGDVGLMLYSNGSAVLDSEGRPIIRGWYFFQQMARDVSDWESP